MQVLGQQLWARGCLALGFWCLVPLCTPTAMVWGGPHTHPPSQVLAAGQGAVQRVCP